MKFFVWYIIFSSWIFYASKAQEVEHNYSVGSQITNCDSLDITGFSMPESIAMIRNSTFRFDQSFRLTRKQGLQLGEYYSCNNEEGFLIIKFDGKEYLYHKVDKHIWNGLISSSDPKGYYLGIKQRLTISP